MNLERSITVRCSPKHAFTVFTQRVDLWWPQSHRRWDGSAMVIEPGVGGRFLERHPSGEEALLGEVLEWAPPDFLAYTWYPGGGTGPTTVEVRFLARGASTAVEVIHSEGRSGLGDQWPERVKKFAKAWDEVLPALARSIPPEKEQTRA